MPSIQDYACDFENKWCPGCGNFAILEAMKNALVNRNLAPHEILIVSGIGQAAKTPHFLRCNTLHSLHGRALPIATGAKIANHELTILVNSGDGDCYGEGGNHFMHAIRRNIDITLLVHNNMVYGLTKGQASPTTATGTVTKTQQEGVLMEPLNPVRLALALGAGFVARGFTGEREHLSVLIQEAIQYRGFSMIDILQPCVSFNKVNTHAWYKKRVQKIDPGRSAEGDLNAAFALAGQWDPRIPIGILFRQSKVSYTDKLKPLREIPLVEQRYTPEDLVGII
jgi:2-oxoglutarate ferredoxin oxidoreductase subunit beta